MTLFPTEHMPQSHSVAIALSDLARIDDDVGTPGQLIAANILAVVVSVTYRLAVDETPRYTMAQYDIVPDAGAQIGPNHGATAATNMYLRVPFTTNARAT